MALETINGWLLSAGVDPMMPMLFFIAAWNKKLGLNMIFFNLHRSIWIETYKVNQNIL